MTDTRAKIAAMVDIRPEPAHWAYSTADRILNEIIEPLLQEAFAAGARGGEKRDAYAARIIADLTKSPPETVSTVYPTTFDSSHQWDKPPLGSGSDDDGAASCKVCGWKEWTPFAYQPCDGGKYVRDNAGRGTVAP